MGFVFLALLGSAAGYIVTRMMGIKLGIVPTVVIGILGTILGSWIIRLALSFLGFLSWIIGAFIGVFILLVAYQVFVEKRRR